MPALGLPLGEIGVPLHIWHGMLDRNAPIVGTRRLAGELPDATLHISKASEHEADQDRATELTSALASAMGPDSTVRPRM